MYFKIVHPTTGQVYVYNTMQTANYFRNEFQNETGILIDIETVNRAEGKLDESTIR